MKHAHLRPARRCWGPGGWLLALACAVGPATAQNLIENGEFAGGLAGWQVLNSPGGDVQWSPLSSDGGATGSALASNVSLATNDRASVLRQCLVPGSPSHAYRFGASNRQPVGQTGGRLVASYIMRPNSPTCTGGASAAGGFYLPIASGVWAVGERVIALMGTPPAGTSIEVILSVDKDAAGGLWQGHFDAVYLIPDGILLARME